MLHSWPLSRGLNPGCTWFVPVPDVAFPDHRARSHNMDMETWAERPGEHPLLVAWWLLVLSFLQLEVRSEGPLDLS